MAYWRHPRHAIAYAGESSKTTHGSSECVDACRYFAGLIVGAIAGQPKSMLLSPMFSPVPGLWEEAPLSAKVAAVARGSYRAKSPPAIRGTGYVVDCLEAALWAFATTADFESAILAAVNLGDDADTTAAVCGQLAGASYGLGGIPERWVEKLAMQETITVLAEGAGEEDGPLPLIGDRGLLASDPLPRRWHCFQCLPRHHPPAHHSNLIPITSRAPARPRLWG